MVARRLFRLLLHNHSSLGCKRNARSKYVKTNNNNHKNLKESCTLNGLGWDVEYGLVRASIIVLPKHTNSSKFFPVVGCNLFRINATVISPLMNKNISGGCNLSRNYANSLPIQHTYFEGHIFQAQKLKKTCSGGVVTVHLDWNPITGLVWQFGVFTVTFIEVHLS